MAVFCKSLCCQYKSNLWWLIPREPRFELWLCLRNSLFHVFLVHFTQLQAPPLPTIAIAGFIQNPSKTVNISSCCLMYSRMLSQAAQRRSLRSAARPLLLEPQKGSTTRSPASVRNRIAIVSAQRWPRWTTFLGYVPLSVFRKHYPVAGKHHRRSSPHGDRHPNPSGSGGRRYEEAGPCDCPSGRNWGH